MQMSVKERLIEFLKSQGMSQRTFEQAIGVSNGYVNNIRVSIQPDKVQRIAQYFPSLNTGWLLTGEGVMIKDREEEAFKFSPDDDFQRSILKAISAVEKIADSNRILAESNHELTTTNKILATSNTDLVEKLAGLLDEIRGMRSESVAKYPSAKEQPGQIISDVDAEYHK